MNAPRTRLVSLVLSLGCAGMPNEPFEVDAHTTLLAHFDASPRPDFARGAGAVQGDAEWGVLGRFGRGVSLPVGTRLDLPIGRAVLNEARGTVEFWMRTHWSNAGVTRQVFTASGGGWSYLRMNVLPDGRFGVAFSSDPPEGERRYRRLDARNHLLGDGAWHHVSVTWQGDRAALWIDGLLAAKATDVAWPTPTPHLLRFRGSGFEIDELRVSDVVRYGFGSGVSAALEGSSSKGGYFVEPPGVYRLEHTAVPTEEGLALRAKPHLSDFEPDQRVPPTTTLELFAAQGQTIWGAALLVADRPQSSVRFRGPVLTGPGGSTLPSTGLVRVVRTPVRRLRQSEADDMRVIGRFLTDWRPQAVDRAEFRELWIRFDIPADAVPGIYRGLVRATGSTSEVELDVELHVYPFSLDDSGEKRLGVYYWLAQRLVDPELAKREIRDIIDHGVTHLVTDLALRLFAYGDGAIHVDASRLRQGLALLRASGFPSGTVVLQSGLGRLARDLHGSDAAASALQEDDRLRKAAGYVGKAVDTVAEEFREFDLVLTHLDEVFNLPERLERYLVLSQHLRRATARPLYITLNTLGPRANTSRQRLDPFVEIRAHHGYSFDTWLRTGNTMTEYEAELRKSGDRAWVYYNERGAYMTPVAARIVNGLYLWASPFEVHVPWIYQSASGDPLDGGDGIQHDDGMAFARSDGTLVSTRIWEAMREGGIDLRYLSTLERLARERAAEHSDAARAAQQLLEQLRRLVRRGQPVDHRSPIVGDLDLESPLGLLPPIPNSAREAPVIDALTERFRGDGLDRLRRRIAEHIVRLTP